MPSNDTVTKGYQEEVMVAYSYYFDFTPVIDQNRYSDPKSCDYRYLSIILTNRSINIE